MADKFFASKTASERSNEAAMVAMAEGVRGDLGQVTAAHAGLDRQFKLQAAKLDEMLAATHQAERASQSTANRLAEVEQKLSSMVVWVKVCALLLVLLLVLLIVVLVRTHLATA